jgi:uncharacterized protein (TIGR03435 family)
VKPNTSTGLREIQMQTLPGGTLIFKNLPLRVIISQAYNLPYNSLEWITGPKWIDSEKFDIEAKAAPGAIPAGLPQKQRNDKTMLMLQAVLADRFKIATHVDIKQGPLYSMVVAKNGLKTAESKDRGKGLS